MKRREVLLGSAGLLALASARLPGAAAAASFRRNFLKSGGQPHFFLYFQIYGAWDVCLAFDPKDREVKMPDGTTETDQPYSVADIKTFGNISLAPHGQVLGKYADRLMVINGINMEVDGGHSADVVMTGAPSARAIGAPYFQSLLAKKQSYVKGCSVPHLFASFDGQWIPSSTGDKTVVSTPASFLDLAGPSQSSVGVSFDALASLVNGYQSEVQNSSRSRALNTYVDAIGQSKSALTKLARPDLEWPADPSTPEGRGKFAGALFKSGAVGSVTFSFDEQGRLDTHGDHYDRHKLGEILAEIDVTVSALQKIALDENTSVMDCTTVVITAEYARTPKLNPDNGKDHHFDTNSLVILGRGTRPGVYGSSGQFRSANGWMPHHAMPVDLATGMPSQTGEILTVRNIWRGFGNLAGVSFGAEFGSTTRPVGFFG